MNLVRIENTQPRILELPQIGDAADPDNFFKAVKLSPGGTNVPAKLVEKLEGLDPQKGPGMVWTMWKDLGYVRVYTDPKMVRKPEGPEAPNSLTDMAQKAALVMVENETSVDTLMKWQRTERRAAVKAAIKSRLQSLELKNGTQPFGSEE